MPCPPLCLPLPYNDRSRMKRDAALRKTKPVHSWREWLMNGDAMSAGTEIPDALIPHGSAGDVHRLRTVWHKALSVDVVVIGCAWETGLVPGHDRTSLTIADDGRLLLITVAGLHDFGPFRGPAGSRSARAGDMLRIESISARAEL